MSLECTAPANPTFSVLDQIQPPQISSRTIEAIATLRRGYVDAQRAVERGAAILCRSLVARLVLFFDEFDAAFQKLDPTLFRILHTARDEHKNQISYVAITDCRPESLWLGETRSNSMGQA